MRREAGTVLESQTCTNFPVKDLLTAEKHGDSDRPSGFDPLPVACRRHGSDPLYHYCCAIEALGNPSRMNAWTAPAEGWGERTRRFLDNGGKVLVIDEGHDGLVKVRTNIPYGNDFVRNLPTGKL
jgi:hypothetical protein